MNLNVGWGNTLLALVATIFLSAPYLFYKYGPWIRSKSRFARHQAAKEAAASGAATPAGGSGTRTPVPTAREVSDKERLGDGKGVRSSLRKSEEAESEDVHEKASTAQGR